MLVLFSPDPERVVSIDQRVLSSSFAAMPAISRDVRLDRVLYLPIEKQKTSCCLVGCCPLHFLSIRVDMACSPLPPFTVQSVCPAETSMNAVPVHVTGRVAFRQKEKKPTNQTTRRNKSLTPPHPV